MAESSSLPPALASLLGPAGLLTDASDLAPALADWRSLYQGRALALLRPANTAELAEAVRLCAGAGIAIVPQGGNTSMVGGATPDASGRTVIVSLARMNRIRDLDPMDMTMTAEAGVVVNRPWAVETPPHSAVKRQSVGALILSGDQSFSIWRSGRRAS